MNKKWNIKQVFLFILPIFGLIYFSIPLFTNDYKVGECMYYEGDTTPIVYRKIIGIRSDRYDTIANVEGVWLYKQDVASEVRFSSMYLMKKVVCPL